MVPRVSENENFPGFINHGNEEACRCLLEDSSSRKLKRPTKPLIIRFAQNFRFFKSLFKSVSSSCSMNFEEEQTKDENQEKLDAYQNLANCEDSNSLPNAKKHVVEQENTTGITENFSNTDISSESVYGTFVNFTDLEPRDNILIQMKEVVGNSAHCSRIAIGEMIALRISRDIIELAEHEPCGLKGCKVIVYLEDCGDRILLGDFDPKEEGFICTFEVNVVLNIKRRLLRSLIPFFACMPQTRCVSDRYEISKEKLYTCTNSRASTPVHWQG